VANSDFWDTQRISRQGMKRLLQVLVLGFVCLDFSPFCTIGPSRSSNLVYQWNHNSQIDSMKFIDFMNFSAWAQSSKNQPADHSVEMPRDYVIGLGDVLDVFVWRNDQLSRTVVVRPDGRISLPLIQDVQAQGLTVVQLKEEITRRFNEHINHPKITIVVSQINSYRVSVLGRVQRPGVYPITGDTTLVEAISAAGGFTEWANKRKITVITHQGEEEKKITVNYKKIASGKDPSQNIILKRGDTIIVP
jgi:polysaccharide export outer membrane protein